MSRSLKKLLLAALGVLVLAGTLTAGEWYEAIKIKGDLRHRFEWYAKSADSLYSQRYRNRVRARVSVDANPVDDLKIGLRLVTGGSDPVSTNQTFDGSFTTKGFQLDRAYFKWDLFGGLYLQGGKYGPAWEKATKAFWDGDLAVEGATLGWEGGSSLSPFVNLNYLWVDEIKGSTDDVMLYLGQAGFNGKFGGVSLFLAANYFTYTNIVGHGMLYDGDDFGNSTVEPVEDSMAVIDPVSGDTLDWTYTYGDPEYAYDYNVIQPSLKVGFKLGDFPIGLHADLVYNLGADENNMGYVFGVKLGKAKAPGSFEIKADYGMLQQDCTMATFVDSDFGGGGTNVSGFKFGGAYQITKKIQSGLTFFYNTQKIASDAADQNGYLRVQADLKFKF